MIDASDRDGMDLQDSSFMLGSRTASLLPASQGHTPLMMAAQFGFAEALRPTLRVSDVANVGDF